MIFLPNLTFSSVCMDKIQTQDSVKHHLSAQFSNHVFFFFVGLECLFLFFYFFTRQPQATELCRCYFQLRCNLLFFLFLFLYATVLNLISATPVVNFQSQGHYDVDKI